MATLFEVPREPFLLDLFERWQEAPQALLIRDISEKKKDWTVENFLYDVLIVRQCLYKSLDLEAQQRLQDPNADVLITVFTSPSYRFAVLVYAIYSIGAIISAISISSTTEDLEHAVELCNSDLIATAPEFQECAHAVSRLTDTKIYKCDLPPSPQPGSQTFALEPEGRQISLEKGCLLIFSSGTTAKPKAVLHTRRSTINGLRAQIQNFNLTKSDTWLHHTPVNWGTGITILIMCIATGARLELCAPYFGTEWLLERLQEGDITCLFLRATSLEPIAERVTQLKDIWPTSKYDALLSGIRKLRVVCSGALRVSPASQIIWKNLRDGRPLMVVYAMTESLTLVATTDWQNDENLPLECCGRPRPGVVIKISDVGEICIKSSALFKRYVSLNPGVNEDIFDSEGFYKTGDLGRLDGGLVFITGRIADAIFTPNAPGGAISASEIEVALSQHPLVNQAIVFSKVDPKLGEQVVALILPKAQRQASQRDDPPNLALDLSSLHQWLVSNTGLEKYKFPTMLRVVDAEQELPVTDSGKPMKAKMRDIFFNDTSIACGDVEMISS
ncbi:hypothetical protein O988_05987 [Pseudogymnoascus sp. VKM F-3808]|nr:hypothetical protein O988_05987 [Pseudogymnoascus sp. VKM F-3808]